MYNWNWEDGPQEELFYGGSAIFPDEWDRPRPWIDRFRYDEEEEEEDDEEEWGQ